ncbi:hypothetical protein [Albidovulum sp.]
MDQKAAFAERLKRIQAGKQYEHADIIGKQTQRAFNRKYGEKIKRRQQRKPVDKLMVLIAFVSGMTAVLVGRVAYFHLSRMQGLPDAFYDLGPRGMILFALVVAGLLTALFHLATRQRLQALLLGFVVMHYGEAAVASNAPQLWSQIFSDDYAAQMAEQGKDFRIQPAS